MKIKNIYQLLIILIFISIQFVLIAQYPNKIFKDTQPIWLRSVIDPALIDEVDPLDQTHWWFIDYQIKDSLLFTVYKYYANNYSGISKGGYIEKINLNTGELIWNSPYYRDIDDIDELPSKMYFNKSGGISVLGFKSIDYNSYLYKMIYREFDSDNGELLLEKSEPNTDSIAKIFHAKSGRTEFLFPYGEDFFYFNRRLRKRDENVLFLLDSVGVVKDTVEIAIDFGLPYYKISSFDFINEDTAVSLAYANNRAIDKDTLELRYYLLLMSDDFNKFDTIDITDDLNPKGDFEISTLYTDEKGIVLYFRNEPELFKWKYNYMIYDLKGKLLDTIDVKGEYNTIGNVCRVDDDEFLVVTPDYYDETYVHNYKLRFYKKKIGEKKRLLNEFNMLYNNRIFSVYKVLIMDNSDVVVIGNMNLPKWGLLSIYPLVIRFKAEDIWKSPNYVIDGENEVSKLDLNIYPNPVKDKLEVEFTDMFTGKLEVIDELGRVVLSKDITGSKVVSIDVSGLDSGSYFVKANNGKDKYKVKAFVKE